MSYVLLTVPNVCSYTTLAKWIDKFPRVHGFISTKLFSFSSPILTFLQKYTRRKC